MSQAASPSSQADIAARPSLCLWALRRELVEPEGTGQGEAELSAGPAQGAEALRQPVLSSFSLFEPISSQSSSLACCEVS